MTTSGVSKKLMRNVQVVCLALMVISSPAYANLIQNGSFSTGDFTDWTVFSTANGSLGVRPLPRITSFDVSGAGPSLTAEFQVGQVTLDSTGSRAGGGIEQVVTTDAGLYQFDADIAAFSTHTNPDAGSVSVLVDGITEDTVNFGAILTTPPFIPLLRDTFSFTTSLSAGMHEIEILITRSLQNSMLSPDQFITNITLEPVPPIDTDPAPEPATWTILCVALAALMIARYRLSQYQGRRRYSTARRSG
jgi:hypothetical protein